MSVIIKGMKKPNNCHECPLLYATNICDGSKPCPIIPVKHGRWVKTGQSFLFPEGFRNYSCSVCGYDIDKIKYRYCPNCGAKMDEVINE